MYTGVEDLSKYMRERTPHRLSYDDIDKSAGARVTLLLLSRLSVQNCFSLHHLPSSWLRCVSLIWILQQRRRLFSSPPPLPLPLSLAQMNIFHRAGTPTRPTAQMSETARTTTPYKLLTTDDDDDDRGIGEKKDEEAAKWFANSMGKSIAFSK